MADDIDKLLGELYEVDPNLHHPLTVSKAIDTLINDRLYPEGGGIDYILKNAKGGGGATKWVTLNSDFTLDPEDGAHYHFVLSPWDTSLEFNSWCSVSLYDGMLASDSESATYLCFGGGVSREDVVYRVELVRGRRPVVVEVPVQVDVSLSYLAPLSFQYVSKCADGYIAAVGVQDTDDAAVFELNGYLFWYDSARNVLDFVSSFALDVGTLSLTSDDPLLATVSCGYDGVCFYLYCDKRTYYVPMGDFGFDVDRLGSFSSKPVCYWNNAVCSYESSYGYSADTGLVTATSLGTPYPYSLDDGSLCRSRAVVVNGCFCEIGTITHADFTLTTPYNLLVLAKVPFLGTLELCNYIVPNLSSVVNDVPLSVIFLPPTISVGSNGTACIVLPFYVSTDNSSLWYVYATDSMFGTSLSKGIVLPSGSPLSCYFATTDRSFTLMSVSDSGESSFLFLEVSGLSDVPVLTSSESLELAFKDLLPIHLEIPDGVCSSSGVDLYCPSTAVGVVVTVNEVIVWDSTSGGKHYSMFPLDGWDWKFTTRDFDLDFGDLGFKRSEYIAKWMREAEELRWLSHLSDMYTTEAVVQSELTPVLENYAASLSKSLGIDI